jgi:hypothetical protein
MSVSSGETRIDSTGAISFQQVLSTPRGDKVFSYRWMEPSRDESWLDVKFRLEIDSTIVGGWEWSGDSESRLQNLQRANNEWMISADHSGNCIRSEGKPRLVQDPSSRAAVERIKLLRPPAGELCIQRIALFPTRGSLRAPRWVAEWSTNDDRIAEHGNRTLFLAHLVERMMSEITLRQELGCYYVIVGGPR